MKGLSRVLPIEAVRLEESRGVKTPMEPGFVLTEEDFAEEPTESMISEMRSLIDSIGYCVPPYVSTLVKRLVC
jgi:hypothetical protein